MKAKKIIAAVLSCTMIAGCVVGMAACGEGSSSTDAAVTISFWNPITGPDAEYMQVLIKNFNAEHEGKIYVNDTAKAEDTHYTNISNSFNDNSSPDLAIIHKSRIAYYEHNSKLRDMTALTQTIGLDSDLYVGDSWTSCEFDGKMYAVPYDVLPTLLFYNRNLIPEGKKDKWEAEITSEDFTIDRMCEMMSEVYVDSSRNANKVYGMAFNYANTDSMFISFLNQLGETVVSADDPYTAIYNSANGLLAAETVKKIPDTIDANGKKVCSESGSDHLNAYKQGRALFTIDGIWSAPGACDETNNKIDTGVVRLPKVNASATRNVSGDGHCFAMFNTVKDTSDEKDAAVAELVKYLIDNSDYWCQGGKVAARSDFASNADYLALEWGHLSNELDYIISPVKVYTYSTIVSPIGLHVSNYVENKSAFVGTLQGELDKSVQESNDKAKELN